MLINIDRKKMDRIAVGLLIAFIVFYGCVTTSSYQAEDIKSEQYGPFKIWQMVSIGPLRPEGYKDKISPKAEETITKHAPLCDIGIAESCLIVGDKNKIIGNIEKALKAYLNGCKFNSMISSDAEFFNCSYASSTYIDYEEYFYNSNFKDMSLVKEAYKYSYVLNDYQCKIADDKAKKYQCSITRQHLDEKWKISMDKVNYDRAEREKNNQMIMQAISSLSSTAIQGAANYERAKQGLMPLPQDSSANNSVTGQQALATSEISSTGSNVSYNGPYSKEVRYLLANTTRKWRTPSCLQCRDGKAPGTPSNLPCQRDHDVYAALNYAYGAESYSRVGEPEKAKSMASQVRENLNNANRLCGNAPANSPGVVCATQNYWNCPGW